MKASRQNISAYRQSIHMQDAISKVDLNKSQSIKLKSIKLEERKEGEPADIGDEPFVKCILCDK